MKQPTPCAVYLQRLAASGRRAMKSQLKLLGDRLNWISPVEESNYHELTYADIEAIKHQMKEEKKAASTINHLLCAIKGINKEAFIMGLVNERHYAQVQSIKRVTGTKNKQAPPTGDEVKQLLSIMADALTPLDKRNAALLAIMIGAGLRRSEVARLQLEHYVESPPTLLVKAGKGNKDRNQPLAPWVNDYILRWLAVRGKSQDYLFFSLGPRFVPNTHLSASMVYEVVRWAARDFLDKDYSPHDLRRAYITQLLYQGIDLNTVRKLAGHASINTTQQYDYREDNLAQVAAQKLSY